MQGAPPKNTPPGFSSACERNKQPILDVLRALLTGRRRVLEVGSGTGQHAVFFSHALPEIHWHPTDTAEYLPGLQARLDAEAPPNVALAELLDVRMPVWPMAACDVVFTANTLHYMSAECVAEFFRGVAEVITEQGLVIVYGPFNYGGAFTSPSNAAFDQRLKSEDPKRGIRDFEWVDELARARQLRLLQDVTMPANNRMLIWWRQSND